MGMPMGHTYGKVVCLVDSGLETRLHVHARCFIHGKFRICVG
jgi:hypothetical protein